MKPAGALLCVAAIFAADAQAPAEMFAYRASEALHFQTYERESANGVELLSISYNGARAPVSATLAAPQIAGKHPAVIFMNDAGHRRDYFIAEALALANARPPALSLLIDAPPARPPGWRRSFNAMLDGNDRDIHVQSVIDVRRGLDLLGSRPDVDPRSMAFVGQSDGARWGAILSAVEPRLKAFVLVSGQPNLTDAELAEDTDWADLRYGMGDHFGPYIESLATVDPVRYLHPDGPPVLFQFGRFDPFISRARGEALARAAGKSGQTKFYVCGHEVNDPEALSDRASFLAAHLGVGKPRHSGSAPRY